MKQQQRSIVFVLLLFSLQSLRAEYKWTGTEWQWVESATPDDTHLDDGSGDRDLYDDADDYDDDSLYVDRDIGGGGKQPPSMVGGFDDDEDFNREGSGDDGSVVSVNPYDEEEGSGDDVRRPSFGGSDYRDMTSTTETSVIDLDNGGRDPYPNVPVNTNHNMNSKEPDYTSLYPDIYGDDGNYDDDDYPPYDDDITIDDVASTTSTTTTTTSTTTTTKPPPPRRENTPIITDVPTNRPVSFFAQPGILAAVIGGAVVGLLCAILLVMFIVYRMRKKDEGSYILDEPTRTHNGNLYTKTPNREFYA